MEWMLLPLKRYADFSGRSRRKEYWLFTLATVVAYFVLFAILMGTINFETGEGSVFSGIFGLMFVLFAFALLVPTLAVQVRRFHDQDKSGWLVLLNLIPYLGSLIVLVMMCLEGTAAENAYGPDPKGSDRALI